MIEYLCGWMPRNKTGPKWRLDMDAVDLHHFLLAGLPAHPEITSRSISQFVHATRTDSGKLFRAKSLGNAIRAIA
jgi:hypothetical protein